MGLTLTPEQVLFPGERPFPALPAVDHYAGTERFMRRALELQRERGPVFDVTLDLEDGAAMGGEREQLERVVGLLCGELNAHRRAGVRIHDHSSAWWRHELDLLVREAGDVLAHITIPKPTAVREVAEMVTYLQRACAIAGLRREIPVHVLIETHGGLQDAHKIARLPWLRGLDFGLMDFVSAHHGAISRSAMHSPGQFEHALVARAKVRVAAAALAHGLVPSHNVTIAVEHPEQAHADALRARREFGFLRMWSIHPTQIDPILAAFTPDDSEIAEACEVLLAAAAADWAPVRHGGVLHDRASYRYSWHVVQRARQAGQTLPPDVLARLFAAPTA